MSAFKSYTAGYLHMRRQVCKKMQEKPGACHKPYIALLGKSLAGSQGPLCTFCTHDNKQHRHLTLTSVCFACPFTPFIVDENLLMYIHTDSARHRQKYGHRIKPHPCVTARLEVRKLPTVVQNRTLNTTTHRQTDRGGLGRTGVKANGKLDFPLLPIFFPV